MPRCEPCGHPLLIEVTAGFSGRAFGPDGFALDELTPAWPEAQVVCEACRYTQDFGAWQACQPASAGH